MVKLSQRHNLGLVMVVVFVLNLIIAKGCFAAAKSSSLTLTLDTNNVAVDITPSADGEFGDSADATITVNTDNFTGYTLQILSKGSTSLTSTSGQTIESIDSSITENTFKSNSSYNNKWGYKPSQYVTSSNGVNIKTTNVDNYLPAPTTSGDTLDITDAPNSSSNSYTISIGARADFDLDAGAYTGDFMIVALSNDIVYNVTYDKNTEDAVQDMPSVNPQGTEIAGGTAAEDSYMTLSDAVPTRTGFTFAGWCDTKPVEDATTKDQTCEGNTYAAGSNLGIDQTADGTNIVIYAIWKVNNYAMIHDYQEDYSYNADGFLDTGWKINWGKDFKIETTFRIPTAGKRYAIVANYNNSAYNLNLEINTSNQIRLYMASGGKDITQGSVPVNTDVNLVFTWNAKTKAYSLTATASGMTDINISGNYPEMTDGVATRNLYTGRDQRGSSTFTPLTMKSLKITDYHPYNVAIGELPTVAKVGYTYDGWYTEATGGTKVNATDLMPDHDATYYVHSAAKTYTITLNGNGATTAGSASATATYDATALSTITNPSRAYNISGFSLPASNNATGATVSSTSAITSTYTFNGWYKEAGATNKIASNATTPALQASTSYTDANSKWTNDGAVTLYAGWTAQAKTLPTITKTGYTCGWTTTATNATTITYASGASFTPTSATTLYGVCTAKKYTITLNGNGGTLGSTSTTATYDATTLSTITNPTRANSTYTVSGFTNGTSSANATISSAASKTSTRTYTFNGWYKESGATNKIASNATTPALQASTSYTDANSKWTNDGAVTLYAGWTASSYSAVTLPTITRTGSTCGWATSSTATTWTYNSGASMTPTGNTVLYGVCRNNITLNGNGATTAGSTSATVDYNATALSNITLPQRKYTVSGFSLPSSNNASGATVSSTSTLTSTYTFNGWYKESGATNKIAGNTTTPALEASTTYTNASKQWTYTTASAVTLYAGWTSQAKTLPTITKTGYTCGWTTTATNATTITYASGASFTPTANTTLYGVCTANNYTVTVKAGNGISALALDGWTGTGTGTLTKTYHINETIDLSGFAPTYKTGYSGVKNVKNDTAGSISGTTYTVGAGNGDITINATTLATPVCTMQGGATKVYNRSATTLTATSNADSYDADSVDITYSFGYATSATATLGNFGTAQAGNTLSVAKAAFRGARYYGVTVVVTDKNDSSITATCTSGTGTNTGTNVANRTTMTLVNSRVQFNAGDGTIASGNNPIYVYYGGTAIYTTRTGSTAATMPTVTPPTGYTFNGWFTAATDGSKVLNADGTATGTAVSGWTNASKQWVKTGTSDSATATANILHAQYSPKTYTITLNGNGATTAGSASATATYDATILSTITLPQRKYTASGFTLTTSGANATVSSTATVTSTYTFNGWYKEAGATNKIASNATTPALQASTSYTDANSKWTNDGAVILYAGWSGAAVTLPTITRTGSTCGWATSSTATTWTYNSGASITPTSNLTLYGVCRNNITLNGNGATTAGSTSATVNYNATSLSTITLPQKKHTVSGFTLTTSGANATVSSASTLTSTYTFNGWYKESGATNKIAGNTTTPALEASTTYTNASKQWTYTTAGAITLYAGWTGQAVTLPTITRTGSTCGWATSSTATTWNYASGASMTPTANTVLYGVCRNNIVLNGNGATTAGSASATVNYNATSLSAITVPQRKYTVSGFTIPASNNADGATVSSTSTLTSTYTFNGWYKETGATNKIASNAATPALEASTTYTNASKQWTYTTASAVTLYAGWSSQAKTLPTITKTGYTCGWTTTATNATTITYASGASFTPTANTTLYGVCTAKKYTITLNGNGATTAGSTSATATYNATTLSAITVPQRKYTASGFTKTTSGTNATVSSTTTLTSTYTFNGWYKETGATNKIASNAATPALQASTSYTNASSQWTNDGAVTLYAGWTGAAITLPTITRTGSTCGWATSSTATTWNYASGASITPTSNLTLYGVCRNNITLNNAGATTAGSTSATVNYNATALSTITVPQRKYTVSGFTKTTSATNSTVSATTTLTNTATFNGWYTASSGGTKIAAGGTDTTPDLQASTTYTNASSQWTHTTAGAITLYSQWTDNAVTLPTITRTGSTCGWATSSTATTWTYNSGASITPTSNLTLYGVCRNNITLNGNGATTAGSTSATVNYNATSLSGITVPQRKYDISGFTLPSSNNASGATVSSTSTLTSTYTFNGWYKESGATNKIAGNTATPALEASTTYTNASKQWTYTTAGAITLYAGWTSQAKTLPTITKTGYTCGWTTTATNATTIAYASGASFTPTANTTLYGVCTANKYKLTITFAGSGVSSVQVRTASGASGGTLMGTVSTSGGSVSNLVYGTNYYLYPTFQEGASLVSWAKTDSATNASLSSTAAANPYYKIGAGNGAVTITGMDCPGGEVCYRANGTSVEGTMANQTISSSATSIDLYPSNFSRSGYGFAGWNTKADGTGTNYGPMETITITAGQYASDGLRLYAHWIPSAGNLQDWTCPASMAVGTVTALKDTRDNDVYAVAKLADGKCWMIENLRLDNTGTNNTTGTLAQGYNSSFKGLAEPEAPWTTSSSYTTANSLYSTDGANNTINIGTSNAAYRFPRYNNQNTSSRADTTTANANIYSYGNYYTWPAAIADTTAHTTNNQSVENTSICPKGWHLPKGGDKTNEANNEFWSLIVTGLNNSTNPANYESSTQPYYTGNPEGNDVSKLVRAYPNNFVYSGVVSGGSVDGRGSGGYYWSSTAYLSNSAYFLSFISSYVRPGTYGIGKNSGRTVRCVMDEAAPANTVVYVGNGADAGTMADQTIDSSATSIDLYPSNFSRSGYGFAGWNTKADGTGTNYGPMETVSITAGQYATNGLKLYAHWIPSAGNLQSWSGCSSLAQGAVTALTDTRDNDTYAVAKLADGKCWMIENLRLDNTATLTTSNTNNPLYSGSTVTLKHNYTDTTTYNTLSPNSDVAYDATTAPNGWCNTDSAACNDQSRLRTDNTASRATNTTTSGNIYSYGNYYNWYSATAGRGTYSMTSGNTAGDLCPKGWHLPTGDSSGEFYALNTNTNAGATNTSAGLRSYPNNFVYSGYVLGGSVDNRGSNGYYWSSTAKSSSYDAYSLRFYSRYVGPGTYGGSKHYGRSIRCVR